MSGTPGLNFPAGPDDFRDALAQFATGVAIATLLAPDGTPHGLTISSLTSVSLVPPLILFCIGLDCAHAETFRQCETFGINILGEDQRSRAVTFSVKPEGRFDGVDWYPSASGAPLIHGCLAQLVCRRDRSIEAGDHLILLGEVMEARSDPGQPLVYFQRSYRTLL